jgi:L-threonylcarbamoyladenylate synthase
MAEIGKDIEKAKTLLLEGKLVAVPTETVYGLAGNALDPSAIASIFEVKGRPTFDPLIVHIADLQRSIDYATELPAPARKLADKYWPGPLTLLLKKKPIISDLVTAGLDTVGLRCPDHPMIQKLLSLLRFPLAAPSANPFGYVSPTRPEHVNEQLGDKISYILDGGPSKVGVESTIVGFEDNGAVVYRLGGITQEQIESVIGNVSINTTSTSNPKAPGQLQSHYSPGKKVIVGDIETLMIQKRNDAFGILSFQKDYSQRFQYILSPSGQMTEAAQNLFSGLRTLDKMPVDVILAEFVPEVGLGKAINDRLRRASYSA